MEKRSLTSSSKANEVAASSGNVFEDMGLPNPAERAAKASLVVILNHVIEEQKLSQTKAAEMVGVSQPDLSKLLKGRTRGFSMDRLLGMLVALGMDISIDVRPHVSQSSAPAINVELIPA